MSKDAMDELVRDAHAALNGHFEELKRKAAELEDELVYAHANREDAEQREREAVAERDALAAHVERLKPALEDFARGQGVCCCGDDMARHTINDGHSPVDSGWYALDQYMSEAPATSLAQRDARVATEALEKARNQLSMAETAESCVAHLDRLAGKYRRQAEEAR
tara:strand:+ start:76845 stop:77339 length:495 start_codon:yes stop_codon:yes gene_type:complete